MITHDMIFSRYMSAKEIYAKFEIDTDKIMEQPSPIPISINCNLPDLAS